MVSNRAPDHRYRCLFFGMPCAFSSIVLDALRSTNLDLIGIVTPNRSTPSAPPISTPRQFIPLHEAGEQQIDTAPRFAVRSLRDATVQATLAATAPDLIVVACFPWLIPVAISNAATVAAINVHPSLLPRWRGPDPLFWTFHRGDRQSGVTLHILGDDFDTGPIVARQAVTIGDGEPLPDLERRLAMLGGAMLAELSRALPNLPAPTPQDESSATSAPLPDDAARTFEASWTVDRVRRFVTGVGQSHGPLRYLAESGTVGGVASLAEDPSATEIQLADGSLRVAFGSVTRGAENPQF